MNVVTGVALAILTLAGLLCVARLLRPGSLADRVVALDALVVVVVTGLGVAAVTRDSTAFVNVLVVTALLGFTGTVAVARFIERRGA